MRYEFTPEEQAFRKEVREFLRQEWTDDLVDVEGGTEEAWENEMSMRKKLADNGWLAMSWPKEYGGSDATVMQQVIFSDEWSYAQAPGRDGAGVGYIGPAIMVHGTEEQKKRHIGGIARGEVVWCQGYSEPEAGSDLASLQTRADDKGDHWLINGQKIWTSEAHVADWILLLARTDQEAPKHRGITMLLADMHDPAITVRPIIDMTNAHPFNEVFFDNLKVSKDDVVGEVNRGWYAGMTLLDFERSGVEYCAVSRRAVDETIKYARETKVNGKSLVDVPLIRNKLANMAVETEVSYMLSYQIAWMQAAGEVPNKEASMGKAFATEAEQRVFQQAMQILGMYGQLVGDSKYSQLKGFIEKNYLRTISDTIQSGTSEIQRRIIATRGLGLPRE